MATRPPEEAAAEVESVEGLLLRVFQHLTLAQRVRLLSVSTRWRGLLLADLCLPYGLDERIKLKLLHAAAPHLRHLDVSESTAQTQLDASVLEGLKASPGLRQLVCRGSRAAQLTAEPSSEWHACLSIDGVQKLKQECPQLAEGSSFLLLSAAGTGDAAAALDVLPGRHKLCLRPPPPGRAAGSFGSGPGGEAASHRAGAASSLLYHPRLAALEISPGPANDASDRDWLESIADALVGAFGGAERPPADDATTAAHPIDCGSATPQLEELAILWRADDSLRQLTEQDCAAAQEAAAASLGAGRVTRLTVAGGGLSPQRLSSLVACCGPLASLRLADRRLRLSGPAALSSLLRPAAASLSSLALTFCDQQPADVLSGLSPLLFARGCRLRDLSLSHINLRDAGTLLTLQDYQAIAAGEAAAAAAGVVATPLEAFLEALSANASLRRLDLDSTAIRDDAALMLAAALAVRGAPLEHLRIRGASHLGPAGAAALSAVPRLASFEFGTNVSVPGDCLSAIAHVVAGGQASLTALTAAGMACGATELISFFRALESDTTLRSLSWYPEAPRPVNGDCADALAALLLCNRTLRVLELPGVAVDRLRARAVGEALSRNTSLEYLVVSGLWAGAHVTLLRAMRGNRALRTLVFHQGSLNDDTDAVALGVEFAASAPHLAALRHVVFQSYGEALDRTRLATVAALALRRPPPGQQQGAAAGPPLRIYVGEEAGRGAGYLAERTRAAAGLPPGLRERVRVGSGSSGSGGAQQQAEYGELRAALLPGDCGFWLDD